MQKNVKMNRDKYNQNALSVQKSTNETKTSLAIAAQLLENVIFLNSWAIDTLNNENLTKKKQK